MWIELLAIGEDPRHKGVDEAGEINPVVPILLEVCDPPLRDLALDPPQQLVVCRLAEIRYVRHDAQLVHVTVAEVWRFQQFWDSQLLLSDVHSHLAVVQTFAASQRGVVRTQPRSDSVHQSTECYAVVPVGREVGDFLIGDLGVDPGEQCILGRQVLTCAANLEVADEGPDETQN